MLDPEVFPDRERITKWGSLKIDTNAEEDEERQEVYLYFMPSEDAAHRSFIESMITIDCGADGLEPTLEIIAAIIDPIIEKEAEDDTFGENVQLEMLQILRESGVSITFTDIEKLSARRDDFRDGEQ
jgi:hypothetical protein